MSEGKARIVAELSGVGQVVGGLKQMASSLKGMALDALRASGTLGEVSVSRAVSEAKKLDLSVARIAQTAGMASNQIKSTFEGLEKRLLSPAPAIADVARSIGRMTQDTQFGVRSVAALGDVALATGRDLTEMGEIGATMQRMGVQSADVATELGRVRDIAEKMGTAGGASALYSALGALSPQLEDIATQSDEARARITALIAAAGKGRSPAQMTHVASGVLEAVKSHAMDLERITGKRQLDDKGDLIDPVAGARKLQELALRANGGNRAATRRALIGGYGAETGSWLATANFDEIERTAKAARDTGANQRDAEKFRSSAAGRRLQHEVGGAAAERALGARILPYTDGLAEALGPTGSLLAGSAGGAAGQALMSKVGAGLFGKALGGGAGATSALGAETTLLTGTATSVGGAGLLTAATFGAPALAVLSDIGEDRDKMGAKWRTKHAETLGAELAGQAIKAGDLMPVIGKAGGDKDVIAALLVSLEKNFQALPQALGTQVAAGLRAELGRAPIFVHQAPKPEQNQHN